MTFGARLRGHGRSVATALVIAALAAPPGARDVDAQVSTDVAVKAALIYNFAKFAEWPALRTDDPIVVCIVGDDPIADEFVAAVRGQKISGHALDLGRPRNSGEWPGCQVLFIAGAQFRQLKAGLAGIKAAPILTVSDGEGFAKSGGIIELYVEKGLMRFAINLDAVQRSGLNLSSRLLGLARLMRDATGD
jgi:hypothetical protein